MTFSLIDELRKELAKTEQLIEFDISKRDQLIEAIRILEANQLATEIESDMRDLTPTEAKVHMDALRSISKPKRRVYTIRNNEALVKLIIPADEYDEYRRLWSDDAIFVCVENGEILYAADNVLETDWREAGLTQTEQPQEFADVLDKLEREEAMNAFRGKVKPITGEMLLEHPQHAMCKTVPSLSSYELKPPNWNHIGAEVAVIKDES